MICVRWNKVKILIFDAKCHIHKLFVKSKIWHFFTDLMNNLMFLSKLLRFSKNLICNCKSVMKWLLQKFIFKSKNETFSLLDSRVNVMLLSKYLRSFFENFISSSTPCVQKENVIPEDTFFEIYKDKVEKSFCLLYFFFSKFDF